MTFDLNKNFQAKDGDDQIVFSETFNVFEEKLELKNFYQDLSIDFFFKREAGKEGDPDVQISGEGKRGKVIISNKFRSSIGSSTIEKYQIAATDIGVKKYLILFSAYGSASGPVSGGMLNVTITFYLRKK